MQVHGEQQDDADDEQRESGSGGHIIPWSS
jgi:hypothetical protein